MSEFPHAERPVSVEQEKTDTYEILSDPETRERLKERMLRFVKAVHDRHVDSLVFLDRSARPLSWMFQDLWDGMYPDDKRPEIKFVNIGNSSHVHKGVSRLLKSYYQGKLDSKEGKIQFAIRDAEKEDVWFSSDDIPYDWQDSMTKNMEIGEELQKIFRKAFDQKHVLIVDEMGASGKSQMATLGFFTMAFPAAKKIESTNIFYSRAYNDTITRIDADFSIVPWLHKLGMSGVIELPEGLLSGAITEENTKKILPVLKEKIRQNEATINDFGADEEEQEILDQRLEWKRLYEHPEELIARARQLRAELKQLAKDALADQVKKTKPLV